MKILISILILLAVAGGGYKIWEYWMQVQDQRVHEEKAARGADIDPEQLSGLPQQLKSKLDAAQKAGLASFKNFIDYCKQVPEVKDPRLAWIELDYVVAITSTDPVEAKKIFRAVKKRTPEDSPILPRIRAMEKHYE